MNLHHGIKERCGVAFVEFVLKFGTRNELESLFRPGCIESGSTVPSSGSLAGCTLLCGHHGIIPAKVVKNKVAPPFKEAEFDIMFGKGISKEGDILDLAADAGIIVKSGAWYAYEGEKIGQGRENAKIYLKENPQFCDMIEEKVRQKFFTEMDENSGDSGNDAEVLENE